jgi:hypothetical protein
MKGAAARMHGYPAREGLGITLTKNQMVETIPIIINNSLLGRRRLGKKPNHRLKPCDNLFQNELMRKDFRLINTM